MTGASARFASVIKNTAGNNFPQDAFFCASEIIKVWDGSDTGISRGWVEEAITGLDVENEIVGRLLLLTALAPYQIDEPIVSSFTDRFPGDVNLLFVLAWACFTAAR